MRLFWMAWSLAVLLVLAAIGLSAWVFAASENWSDLTRIVSRSACGVGLLLAFVGAFRLAVLATASLRFVLAQNLAALIVMELDELRQNAEENAIALARDSMAHSKGRVRDEWPVGTLPIPRFFGERNEIRKLLGPATQETLEQLLASLENYNQIVHAVKGQETNENAVVLLWQGIWAVESKLKQAAREVAPFCLAN
jgi:hypothetical protein